MVVDTTKESLCINKIIGEKREIIVVEGDIIVPDIKPDILSAISTTGNVCIYKKEVMEQKVRLDGCINTYVMYLADNAEGEIRSLNSNLDFTEIFDMSGCMPNMSLDEEVKIKSMECKVLNGRKINIKATIEVSLKIYSNEEVQITKNVDGREDFQSLINNLKINSLVGEGNSKTYAKDTITIDNSENLTEILSVDFKVKNKETKTSYNKILAKADAEIKILYLTQDNTIKMVQNTIPVMGFVDIPNVSEDNIPEVKYKMKNIVVKPNPVEEHSVYLEAELEISCRVYENKEIEIMQDIYSTSRSIDYSKKDIKTITDKRIAKDNCTIKEKISIPELHNNVIYDVEVNPIITNTTISKDRINYEGELELVFLFATNGNIGMNTKVYKIPFNFVTEVEGINNNNTIQTEIEIANEEFIIVTDGMVEVKIELKFESNVSRTQNIAVIDEINLEEENILQTYSMVIYLVKPNDTLWKIAKRFQSTIEDIARVNNLEDPNKLTIGQQLFIPRFCVTKQNITA